VSLDAVVLSHAHVDHCGNLPNLVRQGFAGPIFCTPATRDLVAIMLADSARIQEEDAVVAGVLGGWAAEQPPVYTRRDAERAMLQCVPVDYEQPRDISPDMRLRFVDAGHILGSAMVALTIGHGGRDYRITFTGDLGRRGVLFLPEPQPVPGGDLVICESTYGGRTHDTINGMAAKMSDVVQRTAARGGKGLVPAFSLGRTQLVVHYLRSWLAEGILPRLPLYVDSPLAHGISGIYEQYPGCLQASFPGDGPAVHYLQSREESHEVSTRPGPCIIVASGGMCEGGRIVW